MTDRYAVIGNPISHSKSPQIHQMFAEQTGQDISYEKIEAPLDGFAETIERLRNDGYKGCSVTVPFKFEAFKLANSVSESVIDTFDSGENADAVNTLDFRNLKIVGYNTDGSGLLKDITINRQFNISKKRVLLLGAGGAAYGVLHPLLNEEPKELVITNRTLEKAQRIEKKIRGTAKFPVTSVSWSSYSDLSKKQFDLVINATSAGLTDSELPLPPTIFAPNALAYDMMYGRETPFMKFARDHGAQVADGLGMLVEQAAEAFYLWRGVQPDTAPVIAALRLT
ncbi:MAG: shikimate dehydrogenase [Gallionella sp.]|nr:shikimate dehydrogenase [Gallionella sp.]